jgi:hypothetical protein
VQFLFASYKGRLDPLRFARGGSSNVVQFGNLDVASGAFSDIADLVPTLFSDMAGVPAYQCCNGWTVSGSGAPGGRFLAGNQFQTTASGSLSQIGIAVGFVSGANSFYAALFTDNGGQPGTLLAQSCCGTATISNIELLPLAAGQSYFLVLGPTDIQSNTLEQWQLHNAGVTGLDLYSTDGLGISSPNPSSKHRQYKRLRRQQRTDKGAGYATAHSGSPRRN